MTTNYISCSCNCQPRAVDWAKNGLVCYGNCNSVVIYDPLYHATGKILDTFHEHSSEVKVVQWIENNNNEPETEILTGSLEGIIIIWSSNNGDNLKVSLKLNLGDNLTTAHAVYLDENPTSNEIKPLLICASSFKDSFIIWHRDVTGEIKDKQTLDLNKRIAIEGRMAFLPGTTRIPIIIIALDDSTTHLYAWNTELNDSPINFVHTKVLKGHQDWIRSLDYAIFDKNEALLASGSQDGTIRLWRFSVVKDNDDITETEYDIMTIGLRKFHVSLESVLSGHEHWVSGVTWHPVITHDDGHFNRPIKLLSTALDKTIIIWEPNSSGVWVETVRMGNVGGNSVGYYGCKFNSNGSSVLAHGYQGTFHMWGYDEIVNKWLPRSAPSGHFSQVNDLHWEPNGKYLITTSSDQTTRIHVPWRKEETDEIWYEIARPQIHGYDINCLAILSSTMFASGADEKVVRVFVAPTNFVHFLNDEKLILPKIMSGRAAVPALGLTNKAIEDNYIQGEDENDHLTGDRPPTEEEIIRQSLWPEREKLYGHGYEIFSMSARHDGKVLATACKSSSAEHSSIILWNTTTWAEIQRLKGHRLTVTQMEFSPNDKYLISVSRDRQWSLYYSSINDNNDEIKYEQVGTSQTTSSLHTRIIWCCGWTHDSKYFATGSRDGKIGIWSTANFHKTEEIQLATSLDIKNASVTALSFFNKFLGENIYVLAVGFDDGRIEIQKIIFNDENTTKICCQRLETSQAHHKTIKKLSFRPKSKPGILELASCGSDRTVKIHQFVMQEIVNSQGIE